jgi:hypothetical protein
MANWDVAIARLVMMARTNGSCALSAIRMPAATAHIERQVQLSGDLG